MLTGRIKAVGQDNRGPLLDWQVDTGYATDLDPSKSTLDVADQRTRLIEAGTGDFGCRQCQRLAPGLYRLRQFDGELGAAAVNDWLFTRIASAGSTVTHVKNL